MELKKFERWVDKHSLLKGNKVYNAVGLCGEAGEVANVVKKMKIREVLPPGEVVSLKTKESYQENLVDELGDVLFYLTRVAMDSDVSLEEVMEGQYEKLSQQDSECSRLFKK